MNEEKEYQYILEVIKNSIDIEGFQKIIQYMSFKFHKIEITDKIYVKNLENKIVMHSK